ncbi:uveal autoantigen with coiled-coil domains and ankyrin repeats isoform X2 [Ambystoma mexicanum]|uniref:uveal autoantigen with coiled-coil domains and ankyrin repeats isoform X2 n=1 Tax=Ambystoma mexicanum TaxID=8296 RepID=UPI0037E75BB6
MPPWFSCVIRHLQTADWNKYDDRLMKAAERGDVDKVSSILAKKGVNPSKLDLEGRSAFHVVASKGNLDCLNTILLHGVDITSHDAVGRNALHLSAKYGHSLCLQKLLQFNCPTENVDLQGRTALHDAAMSDCRSSVQLLCDHGASVNAKDGDGRTPLVLATQMCRPAICQLLIDKGADINGRDKQNKTALMLGCEYGCKDAVEVLLKNGADANLLDSLGHDSSYYARIGDNLEILAMIRSAVESTGKGRESVRKGPQVPMWHHVNNQDKLKQQQILREQQQDLEVENEELKERLWEIQREHRQMFDKSGALQQQQLNQKEELAMMLEAKEKEHEGSLRTIESLRARLRYYEANQTANSPLSNGREDALLKQSFSFSAESQHSANSASSQMQSRSMVRPLELARPSQATSAESEALKKELDTLRKYNEAAREENSKLQVELSRKTADCRALAAQCERTKAESDEQIRQLEDALKDVQKRMFDSEGKVKQMQGHFLALKEHLTSETLLGSTKLSEDLQEQLKDMKAKYEGASMEVSKLRNQMKQNEMLLEEMKRDEGMLIKENRKLQEERGMLAREQEKDAKRARDLDGQLREQEAKLALTVPAEKFENMKSLLTNKVNEKAKQVVEVEQALGKSQAELKRLLEELEMYQARMSEGSQEHKQLQGVLERKSEDLGKEVAELTLKNQTFQKDAEKIRQENRLLQQQMRKLKEELASQYVPLKLHAELKKSCDVKIEDLCKQLDEAMQKQQQVRVEMETLMMEKTSLSENVNHLQAVYVPPEKHEKETTALKSSVAGLQRQQEELVRKCNEEQEKARKLLTENEALKNSLNNHYLPVSKHQDVTSTLTSALEKVKGELAKLQQKEQVTQQECTNSREECEALKKQLCCLQDQVKTQYVSVVHHREKVDALNQHQKELQEVNKETLTKYVKGQEEVARLHAAIEGQKLELDTLQECIKMKYAPVASLEERERSFQATVNGLRNQLAEQAQRSTDSQEEARKWQQESERLKAEIQSLQKDIFSQSALQKSNQEIEQEFTKKLDVLNRELREVLQKYADMEQEKERLEDENAKHVSEALAVQARLQAHYAPLEQLENLKKSLGGKMETLEDELRHKREECEHALETVQKLQVELEQQSRMSFPLTEHTKVKEELQRQVAALQGHLRQEEEVRKVKETMISNLQADIQTLQTNVQELQRKAASNVSEYEATKCALEAQVASFQETMRDLQEKYKDKCEEAGRVQQEAVLAKDEAECLQAQSLRIEQEIRELKERYDTSLATIEDLQRSIQESTKQIEAKDNKITELLNDVERLKQALSGLSQLTYTTGVPTKRQNQQVDALQSQVNTLQQQLAEAERRHQEVIATYRTHLLSAVQGRMDEDVQDALLQIIRMRQGLVC